VPVSDFEKKEVLMEVGDAAQVMNRQHTGRPTRGCGLQKDKAGPRENKNAERIGTLPRCVIQLGKRVTLSREKRQ